MRKEVIEIKGCFKCGMDKPLTEFYKHSHMADGHLNKCKECTKKDVKERYDNEPEKIKEYEKKRSKLPHRKEAKAKYQKEHPEQHKKSNRRYYEKYPERKFETQRKYRKNHPEWQKIIKEREPEKYKARHAVSNAIRDGKLKKQPCAICGELKVQAHHEDYSKPLEVVWLCNKHHKEKHGQKALEK